MRVKERKPKVLRKINVFLSLVLILNTFNLQLIKPIKVLADPNTYITGTVLHGSAPIVGMKLNAYEGKCGTGFLATTNTNGSGAYLFDDMPTGDVYVRTD